MAKDKMESYQKKLIQDIMSHESGTKTKHLYPQSGRQIGKSTMTRWISKQRGYQWSGVPLRVFDPIRGKTFSVSNELPWFKYISNIAKPRKKKLVISRSALNKFHERLGIIIMLQSEDPDMIDGQGHYNLEGYLKQAELAYGKLERFLNSSKTTRFELM